MVSSCTTDGSIRSRCRSVTRPKANNSSHLESIFFFFFPHNGAKTCKHLPVCVLINQLLRRRQAAGSTFRSPLPINPTHPHLSPTHPVRVASRCRILPLSSCSIMQIHCLLFTVSVTISWHESRQRPGGLCESLGGRQKKKPYEGDAKSLSLSARKSKRVTARKGFFFSHLLILHLHIFDGTATKEKCKADGV